MDATKDGWDGDVVGEAWRGSGKNESKNRVKRRRDGEDGGVGRCRTRAGGRFDSRG